MNALILEGVIVRVGSLRINSPLSFSQTHALLFFCHGVIDQSPFPQAASSILDFSISRSMQNKFALPKLPSFWHPVIAVQDSRQMPTLVATLRISVSVIL